MNQYYYNELQCPSLQAQQSIPSTISPYTYIIYTDGTTIYAQNGLTNNIDYYGFDASTVIQNAINAVDTNYHPGTGGSIFFRRGTYLINRPINLPSGFYGSMLKGENWEQTKLRANNSIYSIITKDTWGPHRVVIEDLSFDANNKAQHGIDFTVNPGGSVQMRLNRIQIVDSLDYCLIMDGCEDSTLDNSIIANGSKAIRWNCPGGNIWIYHNLIGAGTNVGIQVNAQQCQIDNTSIYSKIDSDCQYLEMKGCYFGEYSPSAYDNHIIVHNSKGILGSDIYLKNTFLALKDGGAFIRVEDSLTQVNIENLKTDVSVNNYYIFDVPSGKQIEKVMLNSIRDTVITNGLSLNKGAGTIQQLTQINFGPTGNMTVGGNINLPQGKGLRLISPNGLQTRCVSIDNNGNLAVNSGQCP